MYEGHMNQLKTDRQLPCDNARWARLSAALMTTCGVLWLALFPLANDGTYTHITRTKWLFTLGFAALTLVLTSAAAIIARGQRDADAARRPVKLNPALVCGGVYFLWVALSAVFGAYAGLRNADGQLTVWSGAVRYEGLVTHLAYGAVFFCLAAGRGSHRVVTIAAGAALAVFVGIIALQYAGLNPLGLFPAGLSVRTNYEFQGTIGNIDMVNGYLSLAVPLLCAPFLTEGVSRARLALLAAGLAGVLAQLMIEVQAGYIAVAAGTLLVVWLGLTRPETRVRGLGFGALLCGLALIRMTIDLPWLDGSETVCLTLRRGRWLALFGGLTAALALLAWCAARFSGHRRLALKPRTAWLLLLGLLALALLLVLLLPVGQRYGGLWEMREVLYGRAQDSYGSWRIGAWRHTLAMAAEHPLFGGGPDTFMSALEGRLAQTGSYLGEHFDNPHNLYLGILFSNGFPALAAYLAMLFLLLRWCARGGSARSLALGAAIVCYSAQAFFSFSICLVAPMAWCVMGMAAEDTGRA